VTHPEISEKRRNVMKKEWREKGYCLAGHIADLYIKNIERAIVFYIYVVQASSFDTPIYRILSCTCSIDRANQTLVKDPNSQNVYHGEILEFGDLAENFRSKLIFKVNMPDGANKLIAYSDTRFEGYTFSTLPETKGE
jgi:hypothetical protein